jgi:hypothetical protein
MWTQGSYGPKKLGFLVLKAEKEFEHRHQRVHTVVETEFRELVQTSLQKINR